MSGKAFTSCDLGGQIALTSSAIDSGERYSTESINSCSHRMQVYLTTTSRAHKIESPNHRKRLSLGIHQAIAVYSEQ